jgi:hypothetical protein
MNRNNIDDALERVFGLIEKRKSELDWTDKGEATVHTYDDGAFVNFFKTWDEYFGGSLKKDIKKFGDYPKNKQPIMVFAKKGINIPLTKFSCKKTYVILKGRIDFFYDDGVILELTDYSTMVAPKGEQHGGMVRKDTFVLVIEEDCDDDCV